MHQGPGSPACGSAAGSSPAWTARGGSAAACPCGCLPAAWQSPSLSAAPVCSGKQQRATGAPSFGGSRRWRGQGPHCAATGNGRRATCCCEQRLRGPQRSSPLDIVVRLARLLQQRACHPALAADARLRGYSALPQAALSTHFSRKQSRAPPGLTLRRLERNADESSEAIRRCKPGRMQPCRLRPAAPMAPAALLKACGSLPVATVQLEQ